MPSEEKIEMRNGLSSELGRDRYSVAGDGNEMLVKCVRVLVFNKERVWEGGREGFRCKDGTATVIWCEVKVG